MNKSVTNTGDAKAPLVSVIIVNYNYERFIAEAIESVQEQSWQHLELIICDDGSTDNSRAVIRNYAEEDPRIVPLFKENAAVAAALNDGFAASRGEVIVLLDADDLLTKDKIEKVLDCLQRQPRVGLVMNNCQKIDATGSPVGRIPQFGRLHGGPRRDQILASGGFFPAAPTSALSMTRECAQKVFPIPPDEFRTEADAYMRTVAALFSDVGVIDEELTIYRVHSSNVTASTEVNLKWCEKSISAAHRVYSVLEQIAARMGWQLRSLERNPVYAEMCLVRDLLTNAAFGSKIRRVPPLLSSTLTTESQDRLKQLMKALILCLAVTAPPRMAMAILRLIYLPSPLKRVAKSIKGL